jgi:hypothetical protein
MHANAACHRDGETVICETRSIGSSRTIVRSAIACPESFSFRVNRGACAAAEYLSELHRR